MHPTDHRLVRIAVIGDASTGKTSLISTAANDTFDARPPPVLPVIKIPPEFSPDHVAMLLSDCSSSPENGNALDLAVQSADAVVICFDALRLVTLYVHACRVTTTHDADGIPCSPERASGLSGTRVCSGSTPTSL